MSSNWVSQTSSWHCTRPHKHTHTHTHTHTHAHTQARMHRKFSSGNPYALRPDSKKFSRRCPRNGSALVRLAVTLSKLIAETLVTSLTLYYVSRILVAESLLFPVVSVLYIP